MLHLCNPKFVTKSCPLGFLTDTPDRRVSDRERDCPRRNGTLYRALRADQTHSKQVAIKLVDRSMLSHRSAELFRHERQTLASLEHPNIARLLDAGTTEGGITA
jgi:serine/threonine protein kinase